MKYDFMDIAPPVVFVCVIVLIILGIGALRW